MGGCGGPFQAPQRARRPAWIERACGLGADCGPLWSRFAGNSIRIGRPANRRCTGMTPIPSGGEIAASKIMPKVHDELVRSGMSLPIAYVQGTG